MKKITIHKDKNGFGFYNGEPSDNIKDEIKDPIATEISEEEYKILNDKKTNSVYIQAKIKTALKEVLGKTQ